MIARYAPATVTVSAFENLLGGCMHGLGARYHLDEREPISYLLAETEGFAGDHPLRHRAQGHSSGGHGGVGCVEDVFPFVEYDQLIPGFEFPAGVELREFSHRHKVGHEAAHDRTEFGGLGSFLIVIVEPENGTAMRVVDR